MKKYCIKRMKERKPPVIPPQGNYFYYFGVNDSRLYTIIFPNGKDAPMTLFLTASWWFTGCTKSLAYFKPR